MSDASVLEGGGHGYGDPLRQLLELDDFGSDFHSASMCKVAHKSSATMCILTQSVLARLSAQRLGMPTQPKSEAVKEYRRQIAQYLHAVRIAQDWTLTEIGKAAGDLAHTTIGRAMKGENTLGFPALLAIERASGVPIPEELRGAAIAAQQPTRAEPDLADEIKAIRAQLKDRPRAEREAFLAELQKALSKAS